jgi:hypothetical protein
MEIYGFTSGGSISGQVEGSIVHGLYPFGSKKDVFKKFGIFERENFRNVLDAWNFSAAPLGIQT